MQQIVTILGVSGIYALLAIGLVLVYKTSRVVSLAQGHIAILFAFFVSSLIAGGYHWPTVLVATAIGCFAVAGIIYFVVMRQLVGEPPFVGLMATIGIAILLRGVMVLAFGGVSVTTYPLIGGSIDLSLKRASGARPCRDCILAHRWCDHRFRSALAARSFHARDYR